jgi:hypothetical protein
MSLGVDAAGTRVYDVVSIAGSTSVELPVDFNLVAGQVVQALGSVTGKLRLTLNGYEGQGGVVGGG